MKRIAMFAAAWMLLLPLLPEPTVEAGKTPVLTYHNDLGSTGQNLDETVLTPANVSVKLFGKLHTRPVDGQIYAQPLYLPNVTIKDGKHDVVFVVTQHDSIYAIDADTGVVLWTKSFINPKAGITTVPFMDGTPNPDVTPEFGITSTPAIDSKTGTIYFTPKTKEIRAGKAHWVYRLHALAVATGAEKPGSPIIIGECTGPNFGDILSGPSVKGKGQGGNGTIVRFNALRQFQRAGVTLVGGHVYLGFSSHGDNSPYHGWVLGFDAKTLKLNAVINLTPNAVDDKNGPAGGGIWQAGGKLVADAEGHLFLMTGNGVFDEQLAGGFPTHGNYGDSFVKLVVDPNCTEKNPNINGWGLKMVDYFTQFDEKKLIVNQADLDLGSGGPLALPAAAGSKTAPNLLVGAGKEGKIFLLNRDNMGKFHPTADQIVQESKAGAVGGMWGNPAYFHDQKGVQHIYFGGVNDHLKAFKISNAKITFPAASQTKDTFGYPGCTPSVSANKDKDGIVWVMDKGRHLLRAYDATDLSKELYNSGQLAADALPGDVTKFTTPTISDGRVYVVSQSNNAKGINSLTIYGLKNK